MHRAALELRHNGQGSRDLSTLQSSNRAERGVHALLPR
jgi:hypothetical protein